jgi:lipoate-protein ligase A
MYVFDLGKLSGLQSMLIFHALARMGIEALVVVSPMTPIVSIGYFQDADKEVDIDFCRKASIPVIRREVGGGATYLDENQIFYQLIWKRDNPDFPKGIKRIFQEFSIPPCETYRAFGIEASFRPENDIVTREGRKIAGQGGGDIGQSMVFVGGILLDFDYRTMSMVLKVPDEKFRDKVFKTIEENLTTMKRELGEAPNRGDVVRVLIEQFEKVIGKLEPATLDRTILERMAELEKQFLSDEFLFKKTFMPSKGRIKIREGVEILYGLHKARGGLIRTVEEISHGVIIEDLAISGDFQFYPKEGLSNLENNLKKTRFDRKSVELTVERFYEKSSVEVPGVEPEDFARAIVEAT